MRTLSPLHIATAAVMALAVSTAFAQAPARPQGATALSPRTVALPPTVSTSSPGTSGTPATANATNGVTDSGSSNNATTGSTTTSLSANTPNAPRSDAALGQSVGQTSAGSNDSLGTNNNTTTGSGTSAGTGSNSSSSLNSNTNRLNGFVPGATGVSTSENGTTVNVNPSQAGSPVLSLPATTPTPLLNETARRAQVREENRRASGREPRVIGIAPRTNADKTDQMPDDRVIRY